MDYDNDGRMDILAGDMSGAVTLFRNIGTKQAPRLAEGQQLEADGKVIRPERKTYKISGGSTVEDQVIPGNHPLAEIYSKIHFADWDGDGLRDLLVGHSSTIVFYKNLGTKRAPKFVAPVTIETPEGRFPLRSSPYVIDWDEDGRLDLVVGTDGPAIYFHRNVGTPTAPKLARGEQLVLRGDGFEKGYRCRFDVVDWNNDGKRDLLVGNRVSQAKPSSGGNIWLFLGK